MSVKIADKIIQYNNGTYMLMDASAVEYRLADRNTTSVQTVLENCIDKLTKEGVEGLLGLTKEEIEAMADLILDTEVRIDKTYSSSKIYSAIQDAIDSSKNFTLAEIGKMSGASYKVVTSTTEMTDEKIIYLLENGATYDMYIVEEAGTVTKIGDTAIDLSSYLKVTDAESAYLKKTEATSTYVAQTSFNNHITDTVAHLTQLEKNKLLTTDNITSTINNSSDNTQIPSAKATYNLANTKADASHTHITSDIKDLSIPSNVSELTNDAGYISEVINTLTSADTDKPLSANQGKILNDTKLNKTDANKLNCVTIDNVSLKEYILTNFTETGKTYYLIAKTTCTDLPKASNFYITVETPGMYTYKVTAKELNDSNGKYVCTYRTISSTWTEWEKVLITGDITTTISDSSTDTQVPSAKAVFNSISSISGIDNLTSLVPITDLNDFKGSSFMIGCGTPRTTSHVPYNIDEGFVVEFFPFEDGSRYGVQRLTLIQSTDDNYYTFERSLSNKRWYSWKRVCTTSVFDVGVTTISMSSTYTDGADCKYQVVNGICYIDFISGAYKLASDVTGAVLATGLPIPKAGRVSVTYIPWGFSDTSSKQVILFVEGDGKMTLHAYASANRGSMFYSFSYPVAES